MVQFTRTVIHSRLNKISTFPFILLLPIFLLTSCLYYYQPASPCAPGFTKKHEIYMEVNSVRDLELDSTHVVGSACAAVSLTKNLAITGSYSKGAQYDTVRPFMVREDNIMDSKIKQSDLGIGYFSGFTNRKGRQYYYDLFIGGGWGKGNFFYKNDFDSIGGSGKFNKYYIQGDIYRKNRLFTAILGTRISYVNFYSHNYEIYSWSDESTFSPTNIFLQEYFIWRIGYKWVKINSHLGLNIPIGYNNKYYFSQVFYGYLGISLDLNGFNE